MSENQAGANARTLSDVILKYGPVRQCPSDAIGSDSEVLEPAIGYYRRAPIDYRRTATLLVSPTKDDSSRSVRGAWDFSSLPLGKITDGLSHTLMYVEVAGLPIVYQGRPPRHRLGPWPSRVPSHIKGLPWEKFHHHEKGSDYPVYSGMDINRTNANGIYSFHAGANVVMCDNSVHFKAEGTDPEIMAAHFSRAGGPGEVRVLQDVRK